MMKDFLMNGGIQNIPTGVNLTICAFSVPDFLHFPISDNLREKFNRLSILHFRLNKVRSRMQPIQQHLQLVGPQIQPFSEALFIWQLGKCCQ